MESRNFQKELGAYIESDKKIDTYNLTVYVTKIQNYFESYGLIKNTIGDIETPLFQEQRTYYKELRNLIFVEYNTLSIDELKKIEERTGELINALQNLKED
ncbi:hypothetical protein [Paenibacillus xylanivorans]|uniref:Uncharacterized protein n=1 Tax=Paenibacillus xylanivorans TaxID=1705561 RepID=A0A0M9BL15_9BACL|nr:hypothetical protein [Paenibacillus xylanivorans]KOY14129.1 hypothetical protein AMS66_23175 [Paenibacillus xylanivorans]